MRRYWWPEAIGGKEAKINIEGDVFKHIFKVCRRGMGDHFELLNADKAYFVKVIEVGKKRASVQIKSSRLLESLKKPHIHLVLAFSQPRVIDRVLEKSVELGVKSFKLISTQNSFLKDQKAMESKTNRAKKLLHKPCSNQGVVNLLS